MELCKACGEVPVVVGYDEHHGTQLVRCGCTAPAPGETRIRKVGTGVAGILKLQNFWNRGPK